MNSADTAKIRQQLEKILSNEAFQDCFILDIKRHAPAKITVFLDSDIGVTLDVCRQISRALEHWLDTSGIVGNKYQLDISSPGVDRPLEYLRQYPKHRGRFLKWKLRDGRQFEGKLINIADAVFTIEIEKEKKHQLITVPFDDVESAIVQIRFNKKQK